MGGGSEFVLEYGYVLGLEVFQFLIGLMVVILKFFPEFFLFLNLRL